MKRNSIAVLLTAYSIAAGATPLPRQIGDTPAIQSHMKESDIENGRVSFQDVLKHGEHLFTAVFNKLDGHGNPAGMSRSTGPDSHSCVSCHNRPRPGGGGDFPTNAFLSADQGPPVKDSIGPDFFVERRTVSLFGCGPIEALALEMTRE